MEKIILAAIDPKSARFVSKGRAIARTITFAATSGLVFYAILHTIWKLNLIVVILFFAMCFGFYFFRNMKRMLSSIAFDPNENVYEIGFIKFDKISVSRLKKEDVKFNVRQDVFANYWTALEIQIVYKRKDYFIQRENGAWKHARIKAFEELLKSKNIYGHSK